MEIFYKIFRSFKIYFVIFLKNIDKCLFRIMTGTFFVESLKSHDKVTKLDNRNLVDTLYHDRGLNTLQEISCTLIRFAQLAHKYLNIKIFAFLLISLSCLKLTVNLLLSPFQIWNPNRITYVLLKVNNPQFSIQKTQTMIFLLQMFQADVIQPE